LANALRVYLPLAEEALIVDNSEGNLVRVAQKTDAATLRVCDDARLALIGSLVDQDD
jgi:hypothetical protein